MGVSGELSARLYQILTVHADASGVVRGLFASTIRAELCCSGDEYDAALHALGERVVRLLVAHGYEYRIGDARHAPIPREAEVAPPPAPGYKRRRPAPAPRLRDDLTPAVLAEFARAGVTLAQLMALPERTDRDAWLILAEGLFSLFEAAIAGLAVSEQREVLTARLGLKDPPLSQQGTAFALGMQRGSVRALEYKAISEIRDGAWPAAAALRIASHTLLHHGSSRRDALDAATVLHTLQTSFHAETSEHSPATSLALGRLAGLTNAEAQRLKDDVAVRHAEQQRERNRAVRFGQLLAGAWWPERIHPNYPVGTIPARAVDAKNNVGSFESALNKRVIWFESYLERATFEQFEAAAAHIAAYQEQPLSLPYIRDDAQRAFYPDVLLRLADGRGLLIEIKPAWQVFLYENVVKISHAIQWCEQEGIGFALATDTGIEAFIAQALARERHRKIAHIVHESRTVAYPALRAALPDAKFCDCAAAVVSTDIRWSMKPFALVAAGTDDALHFARFRRLIACSLPH